MVETTRCRVCCIWPAAAVCSIYVYSRPLSDFPHPYLYFYLYIYNIQPSIIKASLLNPHIFAFIAINGVAGLTKKPTLPRCTEPSCQPIVCNRDTGIFEKKGLTSGSEYVPCTTGKQNGCKIINAPDYYFNKYCVVVENLTSGIYHSCMMPDGQLGYRARTTLKCAPDEKFNINCKGGVFCPDRHECVNDRGLPGCRDSGENNPCVAVHLPSPTSTPTCQCPDVIPNGNQPAPAGYCHGVINPNGYYYFCQTMQRI